MRRAPRGARPPFSSLSSAGDVIVKRMTIEGLTLSTGVGTTIPITSITSGSLFEVASEWYSFANRYQLYRVRAVRITAKAVQPIQTATVTHSTLYQGDYALDSAPTTPAQVLSDENVRLVATHKDFTYTAGWQKNPNARLWVGTSDVLPATQQFAIVLASASAPPLLTGTVYYAYSLEFECEFRGSQ